MSSSVQRAAIFLRLRTFPVKSETQLYCCRSKSTAPRFATRCLARSYTKNGFYQTRLLSSSTDDGDESKKEEKSESREVDEKSKAAKDKLNNLLLSILKDTEERKASLVAGVSADENESDPSPKAKIDLAVPARDPKDQRRSKKKGQPPEEKEIVLGKRVMAAVQKVARTMNGDPEQIESELVQKLKSQSTRKLNISEIVEGMQVDQPKSKVAAPRVPDDGGDLQGSRAERVRRLMDASPRSRQYQPSDSYRDRQSDRRLGPRGRRTGPDDGSPQEEFGRINLFGSRPLGIFKPPAVPAAISVQELSTWDRLSAKELRLAVTHPPANGFEEMILWTEKNMLWKFPIDNEQGMDEEAKWSFSDHIFLDDQIDSWCPDEGPLRNFMELVCVGLSKNAYLTVPEKREYLNWYRDYFQDKAAILKETGSGELKQQQNC